MEAVLAVFDFGEIDIIVLSGDEVDFVKFSFVVLFDNLVALGDEIAGD